MLSWPVFIGGEVLKHQKKSFNKPSTFWSYQNYVLSLQNRYEKASDLFHSVLNFRTLALVCRRINAFFILPMKVIMREKRKNHTYMKPVEMPNCKSIADFARISKLKVSLIKTVIQNMLISEFETDWITYTNKIKVKFILDADTIKTLPKKRPSCP